MRICVLSSGSVGNATIIETEQTAILIDNGLSLKKLQELIKKSGFDENRIEHILITHEHGDHIKGVGVCTRKWKLNVCATAKTIDEMYRKNIIKPGFEQTTAVEKNVWFDLGDLSIMIKQGEKTLVYVTDTGYITGDILKTLGNADAYIMETNHNVEMLQMCNRPWSLKQRILDDCGHLSNEDSAYAMSQLIGEKTKHIYLAHLSQDANLPDLAEMTVRHILKEENVDLSKLNLHMTYAMHPSKVITL